MRPAIAIGRWILALCVMFVANLAMTVAVLMAAENLLGIPKKPENVFVIGTAFWLGTFAGFWAGSATLPRAHRNLFVSIFGGALAIIALPGAVILLLSPPTIWTNYGVIGGWILGLICVAIAFWQPTALQSTLETSRRQTSNFSTPGAIAMRWILGFGASLVTFVIAIDLIITVADAVSHNHSHHHDVSEIGYVAAFAMFFALCTGTYTVPKSQRKMFVRVMGGLGLVIAVMTMLAEISAGHFPMASVVLIFGMAMCSIYVRQILWKQLSAESGSSDDDEPPSFQPPSSNPPSGPPRRTTNRSMGRASFGRRA